MQKIHLSLIILLFIAFISEGYLIVTQKREFKSLTIKLSDIEKKVSNLSALKDNTANQNIDLSEIESRIDDLESSYDDLERKVNFQSSYSNNETDYEIRKLKNRIDELESRRNY